MEYHHELSITKSCTVYNASLSSKKYARHFCFRGLPSSEYRKVPTRASLGRLFQVALQPATMPAPWVAGDESPSTTGAARIARTVDHAVLHIVGQDVAQIDGVLGTRVVNSTYSQERLV